MSARFERERVAVAQFMPSNTRHVPARGGRDLWIFTKRTEVGVDFEIALYYDPDEQGYSAQLVSPELERAWQNEHIGHIFKDGVICLGGPRSAWRAAPDMLEVFGKACLWAEGIAVMIRSKELGRPSEFPFSANNTEGEVS